MIHWGPHFWFDGPTTVHKVPQIVRDALANRSRGTLFLVDPCVSDRSIARDFRKRGSFRDAFEYQQREGIRVGMCRRVEIVVFDELRGRIPNVCCG
jgi:hypothetical protein